MYTNYIFDFYGTLVDISTNKNIKSLWEKLALFYSFNGACYTYKDLKSSYRKKFKETQLSITTTDYPDFPIDNIFQSLFEDKNVHVSSDNVKAATQMFRILSIKYLKLYDGVLELLDSLKEKNKKIYLLSNAQRTFTLYEMRILGIEKYFDGIYFSSDHYMCKPDKAFYNKLIKNFNLDIKDSIMIGNDFIADIDGAHSVGLDSLYINSNLSPEITSKLKSDYNIMDGDVHKIKSLILK
ncbi:HAD family hydrolase [Clostridium beijerinckii]|nr:HAD family hydrolase [Clostridium beijerinckii]